MTRAIVEISAHLDNVDVFHLIDGRSTDDISDIDDIFMPKAGQNFDLSQCSLAVCLVLEWGDLLDGHLLVRCRVSRRSEN